VVLVSDADVMDEIKKDIIDKINSDFHAAGMHAGHMLVVDYGSTLFHTLGLKDNKGIKKTEK